MEPSLSSDTTPVSPEAAAAPPVRPEAVGVASMAEDTARMNQDAIRAERKESLTQAMNAAKKKAEFAAGVEQEAAADNAQADYRRRWIGRMDAAQEEAARKANIRKKILADLTASMAAAKKKAPTDEPTADGEQ